MQALPGRTRMRRLFTGGGGLLLLLVAAGVAGRGLGRVWQIPRRPSQGQVAGQFLRAILRANYSAAYGRLAPEVRQSISLARFAVAARPLWQSGRRPGCGTAIELYKLGVRLGDRGSSRLFYSFSFAADSSRRVPAELLEVTFRDTASRAVLGFSRRTSAIVGPKERVGEKQKGR